MPPGTPVVCPDCGSKNKAGWEFCARCGAALAGAATRQKAAPEVLRQPEGSGLSVRGLLGGLAVLALTAGAWVFLRGQADAPRPSAALFAVPDLQPASAPPAAPETPGSAVETARQRLKGGNLEEALSDLQDQVAQNPDDQALRSLYAKTLWQAGQREAALQQFQAAAGADSAFALDYAKALWAAGRPGEAADQYRAASQYDPNDEQALRGLGQSLMAAKRPAEAVEPLRRVLERAPEDVLSAQELGVALEETGDPNGAAAVYRDLLARTPEAGTARGRLAELLQRQGQAQEAVELLREGLTATPQNPILQRSLGSVLDRTGRRDEAAAAFREFLKLAPNDPDAGLVRKRLAELGQPAAPGP